MSCRCSKCGWREIDPSGAIFCGYPDERPREKDKINELNYVIGEAMKKIAAYEDAEERGLLIRLPCKVGDTVYEVVKKRVDLTGYRMEWGWETVIEAVKFRMGMIDSVGKTVFLTREEAEAVLKRKKDDGKSYL
jgi:hypothetical protein